MWRSAMFRGHSVWQASSAAVLVPAFVERDFSAIPQYLAADRLGHEAQGRCAMTDRIRRMATNIPQNNFLPMASIHVR
jgi:hypothetical protein